MQDIQYIINRLQKNKVPIFLSQSSLDFSSHIFKQTLTTLSLEQNKIGGDQARSLIVTLKNNRVILFALHFLYIYINNFEIDIDCS
jgi:hypothetical protein